MRKKVLIEGMSCEHCVKHVKDALSNLKGAHNVDVKLDIKTAIIEGSDEVTDNDIRAVIEDAGYEVINIVEENKTAM